MKKVLDGLDPKFRELLSFMPIDDRALANKPLKLVRYGADAISTEDDNPVKKDNSLDEKRKILKRRHNLH